MKSKLQTKQKVTIKDIADFNPENIGKDFPFKEIEYIDTSSVEDGKLLKIQKLDLVNAPSRAKRLVKNHDILISTVRPNLKHHYFVKTAKKNTIVSTGFVVIRPINIRPRYLYYFLTSPKYTEYLIAVAESHTSAYPSFPSEIIETTEIILPENQEQKKIGEVLGDIDDKLEVLIKQNKILNKIIKSVFKSCFEDFDGQTEFIDSELGKIPKGWKIKFFSDISTITDFGTSGSFASLKENIVFYYEPEYAILIRAVDFNNNWNRDYVYTDKHGYDFSKKSNVEPGDIMLSNIGNVGTPFFVPDLGKPMTCGKNVLLIKTETYKKEFIFYYLSSDVGQNTIQSILTGSAVPKFNKTDLKNTKLIYPNEELIKKFDKTTFPFQKKIQKNEYELRRLVEMRDMLHQKLISGEIRV